MMKIHLLFLSLIISVSTTFGQVGINANGAQPDPSAMLDVKSSDKGILIPRLTTAARNLIPSPATGLLLYNTTTNSFNFFNSQTWSEVTSTFLSDASGTTSTGGGVSVSANPGSLPDGSAMLDISSSNRGLLLPRTTPAMITAPATGLLIFNTSTNLLNYYTGTEWLGLCAISTGQAGAGGSQGSLGMAINSNGSGPDPSSIMDINASNKGLLIPRITEVVRDGILPSAGLTIYNTTSNAIEYYNGTGWYRLTTNTPVSISITATYNPIEAGSLTIFNTTVINGGSSPVYQWKVNDIPVGENSSYIMLWPANGDVVTCTLTSNQECVSNNPATSNAVVMVVITSCPGTPIVAYGGKDYKTVQIGPQCWFRENLNIGTKIAYNAEQTDNSTMEKYCYNDDEANCDVYGGFYQWAELVQYYNGATNTTSWNPLPDGDVQGLCPPGWHIPSSTDWATLVTSLGGSTGVACKIKEFGPTHWRSPNLCASNISGFTSLGAGARYSIGMFYGLTLYTEYWTSTEFDADEVWNRYMDVDRGTLWNNMNSKRDGYSARCMKDIPPTIPVVNTATPSNLTYSTATVGGEVTEGGGRIVSSRGICYNTEPNPSLSNLSVVSGSGTGSFTIPLTGLIPSTTYFVKAWAINSIGTAYGNEVSFTTNPPSLPTITTSAVTSITSSSATTGGNVSSDGGATVTSRGVCYSTLSNPTTSNTTVLSGNGLGVFTAALTPLIPATTYHLRAFATNSAGTAYGNEVDFTTIPTGRYIGESFGGGIIFYIDGTGENGLIAATSDQGTGAPWGCYGTTINTSEPIGTGQVNTPYILTRCGEAGIAARICSDLVLNGFDDWFSPSKDELNQLFIRKDIIGGFTGFNYWSSTASSKYAAWSQNFTTGIANSNSSKSGTNRVRAIRIFDQATSLCTLSTTAVSNISQLTATSGGNITSAGGGTVGARGVCWSTTANPTTAGSHTTNGTGIGVFESSLTGLTAGTLYHVRAYAINSLGTAYGNDVTFTTMPATLAVLSTSEVIVIGNTYALSGGNITNDGAAAITSRGVCWSLSADPTIADSKTSDGTGSGIFTSSITGLTLGLTYNVRAYATNSVGTAYGNPLVFTTVNATLATITTNAISAIGSYTAIGGGEVNSNGGALVSARGVCWNTSGNPTISNSKTTDGTGKGTFTSSITGLSLGSTYYVKAYATNSFGTAYGTQESFTTAIGIGDSYYGGRIGYIFQSGDPGYIDGEVHGLIISQNDMYATWGCTGTPIPGADGTALGTGSQNTIDIVNECPTADIAARVCEDLTLNGYSDWYLPSKDELNKIYLNNFILGIPGNPYWSSTEADDYGAWFQWFGGGSQEVNNKANSLVFRPVRTF